MMPTVFHVVNRVVITNVSDLEKQIHMSCNTSFLGETHILNLISDTIKSKYLIMFENFGNYWLVRVS